MQVLATIAPLDPATGSRVTLRASSADRREMLALNSVRWVPAIIRRPSISDELFDGNFTGVINDGGATIDLAMFGLKRQDSLAAKYRYAGAAVTIYEGDIGDAWPWTTVFTGIVDTFTNDAERLSLRLKVNTTPFGVPALTATYAGTGGKEGGADLKFKVKPWCFGAASNVQPVLIDVTNSVYQVSAYGPINGVTACYERGASFGASYGNYTTYANLVAASIPPGRWATCLAEGMIRLGAPETGLITADVEGDKPSTFLRKTGEIIDRICTNAAPDSGKNLLLYSEQFDNAAWVKVNCTVTANALTAPDGTTTADTIVRTAVGNHYFGQTYATTGHAGKTFTFSCWIKAGTMTGNLRVWTKDGGGTTCGISTITPTGSWVRYTATGTFGASPAANVVAYIDPVNDTGVIGDTFHVWGAMLSIDGAEVDYAPTTSRASTNLIDSTSLNGLDTALTTLLTGDGYINLYLTEQTTVMEIAQRLARPCNAAAGVHPRTGKLYVCRTAAIGTSVLSLNAQGRKIPSEPGVLACVEQDVSPPYWRIEMQGQRSWRVHSASEIAFTADLVEVGDYAGGTTYREGNIVTDQGGRWLYINPTAAAGNAPPTLPTTSNSYWSSLTQPVDYTEVAGTKPPSNADNTASQTIVSRLSPTTGQALDTFVLANGLNPASIVAQGSNRDGDTITFAATLPSVPKITFLPGGNTGTAAQNILIQAIGLSASGFTLKAKTQSVSVGSTITDTGATTGGGANPDKVMNRSNSGHPYNNVFKFTFAVTVGDISAGEPGRIDISIYAKISGSWTEIDAGSYSVTGTKTLSPAVSSIDFGAGDEFGISATYVEGSGTALGTFSSVIYILGSVTETSLTPSGASDIPWLAIL